MIKVYLLERLSVINGEIPFSKVSISGLVESRRCVPLLPGVTSIGILFLFIFYLVRVLVDLLLSFAKRDIFTRWIRSFAGAFESGSCGGCITAPNWRNKNCKLTICLAILSPHDDEERERINNTITTRRLRIEIKRRGAASTTQKPNQMIIDAFNCNR